MNDVELSQYMLDTFEGVDVVNALDASFFFYNPDSSLPPDHKFPFVTIVTTDAHDQFSDLNRPEVFRLNIGVSKHTFQSRFGKFKRPVESTNAPASPAENDAPGSDQDFTALDQLMPHPVYGMLYWVCVLNPSDETFETTVRPLLAEAYAMAVSKYDQQADSR